MNEAAGNVAGGVVPVSAFPDVEPEGDEEGTVAGMFVPVSALTDVEPEEDVEDEDEGCESTCVEP